MKKLSLTKLAVTGMLLWGIQQQSNAQTPVQTDKLTLTSPVVGGAGEFLQNTKQASGDPYGISLFSNNVSRMTILNDGKIGIGTASPGSIFTIKGDGYSGTMRIWPLANNGETSLGLYANADGTGTPWIISHGGWSNTGKLVFGYSSPVLSLLQDGHVGIGTTSPAAALVVKGTGVDGTIRIIPTVDSAEAGIGIFSEKSGTGDHWMITHGGWGNKGKLIVGFDNPLVTFQRDGNVGIGTTTPNKGKLHIKGSLHVESDSFQVFHVSATKALVFVGKTAYQKYLDEQSNPTSEINKNAYSLWVSDGIVSEDYVVAGVSDWDDYVFNKNYQLPSLKETEAFIQAHKHLPNIPSEAEVKKNGYDLHRMNRNFLKTMEELTLYAIDQEKKVKELEARVSQYEQLAKELEQLKAQVAELKNK